MSLIKINAGSKSFHEISLFNNLNLQIDKGDRLAIIGANGSGKTTLCKIILGELELDSGEKTIAKGLFCSYLSQNVNDKIHDEKMLAWQDEQWLNSYAILKEAEEKLSLLDTFQNETDKKLIENNYQNALYNFEHAGGYNLKEKMAAIISNLSLPQNILEQEFVKCSVGKK